jgi:hypothetical protein
MIDKIPYSILKVCLLNGLSFIRRTDNAVYRVLLITRTEQQQQQELQHGDAHSCCFIQLVTVHFV